MLIIFLEQPQALIKKTGYRKNHTIPRSFNTNQSVALQSRIPDHNLRPYFLQ